MPTPAFSGSIPETYHRLLGPLLFEGYARDIAARLAAAKLPASPRILELACGTGIVTRALLGALPASATLLATDVSQPMIDQARRNVPADPRLSFQPADGCTLPFPDSSFDAIVCQYGVMFFPDKVKAMREARRVLRPRGVYLFNVWDGLDANPIPGTINRTLEQTFPGNPPRFLHTPYGWGDRAQIERTVRDGGFADVRTDHLVLPSEAPDAAAAATGFLQGTPLAADLADRKADLPAITAASAKALAARFGDRPCRATMGAWVVTAG